MSKFKVGDNVKCLRTYGEQLTEGKIYKIVEVSENGTYNRVVTDTGHLNGFDDRYFQLAGKSKPAKKYTETDRRKAAKAVRIAEAKLSDAIKKAKDAGIIVTEVNSTAGKLNMSYQPETPKKRVYK